MSSVSVDELLSAAEKNNLNGAVKVLLASKASTPISRQNIERALSHFACHGNFAAIAILSSLENISLADALTIKGHGNKSLLMILVLKNPEIALPCAAINPEALSGFDSNGFTLPMRLAQELHVETLLDLAQQFPEILEDKTKNTKWDISSLLAMHGKTEALIQLTTLNKSFPTREAFIQLALRNDVPVFKRLQEASQAQFYENFIALLIECEHDYPNKHISRDTFIALQKRGVPIPRDKPTLKKLEGRGLSIKSISTSVSNILA